MVEFTANKSIQIKRIKTIAEIKTREKRPDIIWLLRHYKDLPISEGEKQNIARYLELQFGLLKNDYPTAEGKEATKSGFVLSPQYGLYRIYYIEGEPIFGKPIVIGFEPVEAKKDLEAFLPLENFQELEAVWNSWQKITKETEFILEFEHTTSNNPLIVEEYPLPATLSIEIPIDGITRWKIKSEGDIYTHEEKYPEFDLNANLQHLLSNWDAINQCVLVKFSEIKDISERETFTTSKIIENISLIIKGNVDDGHYSVNISNIPIRPKDMEDARNWLLLLLLQYLKKQKAYCTTQNLLDEQKKILKKTPLKQLHSGLKMQMYESFIQFFKENVENELIREIIVADDLSY